MKKTTVVLIGLIYIMSVVVVGILGLQYQQFNQIVDVESITVTNTPDGYYNYNGQQIKKYEIAMNPETGLRQFQIKWEVEPVNRVTNSNVKFIYDPDKNCTVNQENGLVEFTKRDFVVIKIVPEDGSNCYDQIIIFCNN